MDFQKQHSGLLRWLRGAAFRALPLLAPAAGCTPADECHSHNASTISIPQLPAGPAAPMPIIEQERTLGGGQLDLLGLMQARATAAPASTSITLAPAACQRNAIEYPNLYTVREWEGDPGIYLLKPEVGIHGDPPSQSFHSIIHAIGHLLERTNDFGHPDAIPVVTEMEYMAMGYLALESRPTDLVRWASYAEAFRPEYELGRVASSLINRKPFELDARQKALIHAYWLVTDMDGDFARIRANIDSRQQISQIYGDIGRSVERFTAAYSSGFTTTSAYLNIRLRLSAALLHEIRRRFGETGAKAYAQGVAGSLSSADIGNRRQALEGMEGRVCGKAAGAYLPAVPCDSDPACGYFGAAHSVGILFNLCCLDESGGAPAAFKVTGTSYYADKEGIGEVRAMGYPWFSVTRFDRVERYASPLAPCQ